MIEREVLDDIYRLYKMGYSLRRVAAHVRISYRQVKKVLGRLVRPKGVIPCKSCIICGKPVHKFKASPNRPVPQGRRCLFHLRLRWAEKFKDRQERKSEWRSKDTVIQNRWVRIGGMTVSEVAAKVGVKRRVIYWRISQGWTAERILGKRKKPKDLSI